MNCSIVRIASISLVVLAASLPLSAHAPPAAAGVRRDPAPLPAPRDAAARVFEKFRALEGRWIGSSTKGWTEESAYRTIAGGSVVMSTSFDAHPNETMATFLHLDGERLLLTHYCVARNQPRLVLTRASDDGSEATFEFLDATGMASRDVGHMDQVVYKFDSDGTFTSQWTWYQDGEQSWMEEIRMTRDANGGASASGDGR